MKYIMRDGKVLVAFTANAAAMHVARDVAPEPRTDERLDRAELIGRRACDEWEGEVPGDELVERVKRVVAKAFAAGGA